MSFLLWQKGQIGVASGRQVFRANEVPLLQDASALVARLQALWSSEDERVQTALDGARQQGLSEGTRLAQRELEAALNTQLALLARDAEAARDREQREVGALALEVVRKLLGALPEAERLAALAQQAARELLPARTWRLAVHPAAVDALRDRLARLDPDERSGLAQAVVGADPSLPDGDCRLDTDLGSARAGLDEQLTRLAAAWGVAGAAKESVR
jgi:flagellar biosynthesis/type III secretory pathway protein FliH